MEFFLGFFIGLFVAMPIGPVAVLCVNRSLQYGLKSGVYTGLGVAFADFLYGCIAVFGLFAISTETLENQPMLRLAGALCVMFIGIKMITKKEQILTENKVEHETMLKDFTTGFLLTLSNPMTIVAFVAALSSVNIVLSKVSLINSLLIVFGILTGSFLWWLMLSNISVKFKFILSGRLLNIFNVISGSCLFIFGVWLIYSLKGL